MKDFALIIHKLQNLTNEEFQNINDYVSAVLKSQCTTRTITAVRMIGIRTYCENFLFVSSNQFYKQISRFRNCSTKTQVELTSIHPKIREFITHYLDNIVIKDERTNSDQLIPSVEVELTENHFSLIELQYNLLIQNSSSVRIQNALSNIPAENFVREFVQDGKNVLSIRGLGRRNELELLDIVDALSEYIKRIRKMTSEEISAELLCLKPKQKYNIQLSSFAEQFYNAEGHYPLFNLIGLLLSTDSEYVRDSMVYITFSTYSLTTSIPKESIQELSERFGVGEARVRQIKDLGYEQFLLPNAKENQSKTKKSLFKECVNNLIQNEGYTNYLKSKFASYNFITRDDVSCLLKEEKSPLSIDYALIVLADILGDEYIVFNVEDQKHFPERFLISQSLARAFDFNNVYIYIKDYLDSVSETVTFDISELIQTRINQCVWLDFDSTKLDIIENYVYELLVGKIGLLPDFDGLFTVECSQEARSSDILYDILKANGNSMNLNDLYAEFEKNQPGRYKAAESIRSILQNDNRVVSVGRNSEFALAEWNHVKIGSIRSLIAEYLASKDTPQHIDNIFDYIQQFVETNKRSVKSTMGSGSQFVQFQNSFYGLADKTYKETDLELYSARTFNDYLDDLDGFIVREGHFPFGRASNKTEASLYRWLYNQTSKGDELPDEHKDKLDAILEKHEEVPKDVKEFEWEQKRKKFIAFCKKNGRRPQKDYYMEKDLYSWFSKCQDDFIEGRLNPSQEKKFINLCRSY
ncbi:MAG: hypothetical protein MJZ32_07065 [Bacteroidaceae bacterium]|nr:hypothetical protein [Bacteroidaceae bacterium]